MNLLNTNVLHFFAGFAITLFCFLILSLFPNSEYGLVLLIPILFGIGKEYIYDKWLDKGVYNLNDFMSYLFGVLSFFITQLIFDL